MNTAASTAPSTVTAARHAGLSIAGLEQVYDSLALALDQAPAGKSELLLTKLALLLAQELADPARFDALVALAALDLGQVAG